MATSFKQLEFFKKILCRIVSTIMDHALLESMLCCVL